ncbi:MAG TPA: ClpX C4-type zinc finger protein [Kofleriaceae bacterium]
MHCPICKQPLEGGELVMVCGPCHCSLGGGLSLGATGEFRVPAELLAETDTPVAENPPQAGSACAWCGKAEIAVKKLLGRRGTALCDECVALAADIMEAELGPDWR